MKCPHCNAWTLVLETRNQKRKRQCAGASGEVHVFYTREVIEKPKAEARREKMRERDDAIIAALKAPGATRKSVSCLLGIPKSSIYQSISRRAASKGKP